MVFSGQLFTMLALVHRVAFNHTYDKRHVRYIQHALHIDWLADLLCQTLCRQFSDLQTNKAKLGDDLYVWLA